MTGDIESATKMTVILHTVLILAHYSFETLWSKRFDPPPKGPTKSVGTG